MGATFEAVLSVIAVMAALGVVGSRIGRQQHRNPYMCSAICALFPLVGIGLLMMLGPKSGRQRG